MTVLVDTLLKFPDLFDFIRRPDPVPLNLLSRGLLPPLPVVTDTDGDSELIWGRAVLEAAEGAGKKEFHIREFKKNDLHPKEALVLALTLENRRGRYTWEEAGAVCACMKELGIDDDDGRIADLVFTEGTMKTGERWAALPEHLKDFVASGTVDLKNAEQLTSLRVETAAELKPILEVMSFSDRRIFLKTFQEIVKRDRPEKAEEERLVRRLRASLSPKDAIQAVRYPELTAMEKKFTAVTGAYLKGRGISLKPPPYFEGSNFSVAFTFNSRDALVRKLEALMTLAKEADDELFSLL